MARQIPAELEQAIQADLRANWGTVGLRQIGRRHGVADSTVLRVARAAGIEKASPGPEYSDTKKAVQDRRQRLTAQRQALAEDLLRIARDTALELAKGSVVTGVSFGEVVSGDAHRLTARDRQALLTSLGIALDKHRMLENFDTTEGAGEIANFLRALSGGGS